MAISLPLPQGQQCILTLDLVGRDPLEDTGILEGTPQESRAGPVTRLRVGEAHQNSHSNSGDRGASTPGSEPIGTGPPTTRTLELETVKILLFPFYYFLKSHMYLVKKSKGTKRCITEKPITSPPLTTLPEQNLVDSSLTSNFQCAQVKLVHELYLCNGLLTFS